MLTTATEGQPWKQVVTAVTEGGDAHVGKLRAGGTRGEEADPGHSLKDLLGKCIRGVRGSQESKVLPRLVASCGEDKEAAN